MLDKNIQYYGVGIIWKGDDPENQLPRFIKDGIWENAFSNKYLEEVTSVKIGSRIAAKTTFTVKFKNGYSSILKIHGLGTVIDNPKDGQSLKVKWDKNFSPIMLKNIGGYRSTINQIINPENIKKIFKNEIVKDEQIIFYSKEIFNEVKAQYPCFVFTSIDWDDYGLKAMYKIDYFESRETFYSIGAAKFYNRINNTAELPNKFDSLSDKYCSLGQSNSYYYNLKVFVNKKVLDKYLDSINDLATNKGLVSLFENKEKFKSSVLRSSEAQKALREGFKIIKGIDIQNYFKFTFTTKLGHASKNHSIEFDFSEKTNLPFRIKVLVGKNGTGKTQYIANLASTLSGLIEKGLFSTKYLPPFSRIIAVSYSLFDRFPRPTHTKTFSYYYCGFQNDNGLLSDVQIETRLKYAFQILEESGKMMLFGKYLGIVLSKEIVSDILDDDNAKLKNNNFTLHDDSGISKYSSGQLVIILILAELLAFITFESLLIFDEPETHLHPNSISRFISVINEILEKFNSYSIISTHSPQFVQEVPSKDILVIERFENLPSVRGLGIESFGENLNTITERIFNTNNQDEFYREFLKKLSRKLSFSKIVLLFEKNSLPLSLNAKIYLQSLY